MKKKRNTIIHSGNGVHGAGAACRIAALGLALVSAAAPLPARGDDVAPGVALGLPLQCRPGTSCWVANYPDADAGPGVADFRCGARTYDGHDGVDFAIRDRSVMAAGVPVLAAATGTVKNVRDGMADTGLLPAGAETALKGRECGNGVVIDHGGGWQTQYCHLRQGSVLVTAGQPVTAGAILGAVGMSGWADFPHVHLAVRYLGTELDPFTGRAAGGACGQPGAALWRSELNLDYEPAALYNAGFSAGPPDIAQIRAGQGGAQSLTAASPALVLWVEIFGVRKGDVVNFSITGPGGVSLLAREQRVDRTQARRYIFMGTRRPGAAWPAGEYRGQVRLLRSAAGADSWQDSIARVVTLR